MKYVPTIGLEIHAELKTKTKMFCACLNDPNESHPNVNVCPVCAGHPGTLPTINAEAVRKVLAVGKALGGKLAGFSRFDRKNYFYPDLPKGYQISQFKHPLVRGGGLLGARITRIHLEEDAGKLAHSESGSLVDLNRAGVPLMELVTEPDFKSGEDAADFARELQLILRYLDASDADMEKGQMRVEANVSVRPTPVSSDASNGHSNGHSKGQASVSLGTKVEIKNLNSFKAVERAVNHEIARQSEILRAGGKIVHETRGWDETGQKTFSQRKKEESHDYRYFPEPDLPPLDLEKSGLSRGIVLPELPADKRERFGREFGLPPEQAEIFVRDKDFSDYFEEVASEIADWDAEKAGAGAKDPVRLAANYLTTDLASLMKEKFLSVGDLMVTPENFAELMSMINKKEVSSRAGKDILRMMVEGGGDPSAIAEESGLGRIAGEAELGALADEVIKENASAAEEFRGGKEAALGFLIGRAMKRTRGSADPEELGKIFRRKLS